MREACERPRASADDDVVVRVRTSGGRLAVEVADLALPVSADESRHARSRKLAALGFVDELHIGSRGRAGNLAACAVPVAPRPDGLDEQRIAHDVSTVSDEEAAGVEFRAMREGDARELVRCVYRCYGYSYKDPALYEPREIVRALRTGTMTSAVAVAPDGAIVGHSAVFVEQPGDAVPESGRLLVDPRYRGRGIATRLATLRRELAERRGVPGFWSEAVTNHVASQREVIHGGGSEVGLLIGASPAGVAMVGFENANRGRRTLLAMFTPIRPVPQTLHVPARHADFTAGLADRLGVRRAIRSDGEPRPGGRSVLSTSVRAEIGVAHLRVQAIGADLASQIADALDGLDAFDLGAVHLDLPLADSSTPRAGAELERLGFSFGAWIPRFAEGSDVLRLQRVEGHPVETENVICARREGELVRDYVLADWRRVRRAGIDAPPTRGSTTSHSADSSAF